MFVKGATAGSSHTSNYFSTLWPCSVVIQSVAARNIAADVFPLLDILTLTSPHSNYRQTSNISRTLVGNKSYRSHRCIWCLACRRRSNHIFILDLTPGLNGLGKENCKTRWETDKFRDLYHRSSFMLWQFVHLWSMNVVVLWNMHVVMCTLA